MKKSNAALLVEIEQMENEVNEARKERDNAFRDKATLHAHAQRQEEEIKWLKRIIEGLTNAPSIPTRPR